LTLEELLTIIVDIGGIVDHHRWHWGISVNHSWHWWSCWPMMVNNSTNVNSEYQQLHKCQQWWSTTPPMSTLMVKISTNVNVPS
jgi:hypothetical protein